MSLEFFSSLFAAFVMALAVAGGVFYWRSRLRREHIDTQSFSESIDDGLNIPPSLHPVIDPKRCIGSLACISACPEGDILGVVSGKASLIHAANCIGHGKCAQECPVGAITLVFGTAKRGVDLPEIDASFESSRLGVHVVGELGGMGLIRNAVGQGVQVAEVLASRLAKSPRGAGVDVAIVGAGPAGIATALRLKELGLTFELLEQGSLGGTVANYPRQKLVMVEPVKLPYYGTFGKKQIGKKELLDVFSQALNKAKVSVHEHTRVTSIEGKDGAFEVHTGTQTLLARKVVLATGRRGSPRKLGVPGEDLPKVTYKLLEPEQYAHAQVLIVGGGDSALEAAIMLAEKTQAKVIISYRGPAFGRCRPANKEKILSLIERQRVRAVMESEVSEILPGHVKLSCKGQQVQVPNDYVIVCAGGELPLEFLRTVGVSVTKHFGTQALPKREITRSRVLQEDLNRAKRERYGFLLALWVALTIIGGLLYIGRNYYFLPIEARVRAPEHAYLKPGGLWGHGIGIVATLVMLTNFLYAARKRLGWLKGVASIRRWLNVHMFVGVMTPCVIVFHAAFQSKNMFATTTFVGLLVVCVTGILGRFVYLLMPSQGDRDVDLPELLGRWEQHRSSVASAARRPDLFAWLSLPSLQERHQVYRLLISWPRDYLTSRKDLLKAKSRLSGEDYAALKLHVGEMLTLRRQIIAYASIRRILLIWRICHVVMAIVLVVLIAMHIGISLYYGYRWVLS